jgi:hypothetical protein
VIDKIQAIFDAYPNLSTDYPSISNTITEYKTTFTTSLTTYKTKREGYQVDYNGNCVTTTTILSTTISTTTTTTAATTTATTTKTTTITTTITTTTITTTITTTTTTTGALLPYKLTDGEDTLVRRQGPIGEDGNDCCLSIAVSVGGSYANLTGEYQLKLFIGSKPHEVCINGCIYIKDGSPSTDEYCFKYESVTGADLKCQVGKI